MPFRAGPTGLVHNTVVPLAPFQRELQDERLNEMATALREIRNRIVDVEVGLLTRSEADALIIAAIIRGLGEGAK